MKKKSWHTLYEGLLQDAPGRNESWDDEVRYEGRSLWTLRCVGTDFDGLTDSGELRESLGTRKMVKWVLERDAELNDQIEFGAFSKSLLKIATEVGADYCVSLLNYFKETGELPPPKILEITGKTSISRQTGLKSSASKEVYTVRTEDGHAWLTLSRDQLILPPYSWNKVFKVKPSKKLLKQADSFL